MPNDTDAIEVFISYAAKDSELCEELEKHLRLLKDREVIRTWHDGELLPGSEKAAEIVHRLEMAKIILLLVSVDFLNVPNCVQQMNRAIERHQSGDAVVIPIKLRAADYTKAPFEQLQVLPRSGIPVNTFHDRDQIWEKIVKEIQSQIERIPKLSYYVARKDVEARCLHIIRQPGSLLRIKAPTKTGKTYLAKKLVEDAKNEGFRTAFLSLESVSKYNFYEMAHLVRWFCDCVGAQLEIENRVEDYWKPFTPCRNITNYFQKYLLEQISAPILLVLDDMDSVLDNPSIRDDFCYMLRSWHLQSKIGDSSSKNWQKLRLIIIHATEIDIPDINRSPLSGVGELVPLEDFNVGQIEALAKKYGIYEAKSYIEQLIAVVGGHPYLLHLALSNMQDKKTNFEELIQSASSDVGIYAEHFRYLVKAFQRSPELVRSFKELVLSNYSTQLSGSVAFNLQRLGLIKTVDRQIKPRCLLYHQYFLKYFTFGQ